MIAPRGALGPANLIADCPEFGSPPLVYKRLVEVINHPRGGAHDLADVIRQDTALTGRLLKLVNSAFFSFPKKIETISQAVGIVGTSQLRDLALATSITELFREVPPHLVDVDGFWRHSLACGVAARVLASMRTESNVERFFVAGILHDIGRLVLFMRVPEESNAVIARARACGAMLYETERDMLGFDHARVGGALMDHWKMPESLKEAVRFHHEPLKAVRFPLDVAIVHVADILANALQLGSSGERFIPPLSAHAWTALGLDPRVISFVIEQIDREYEAALLSMGFAAE
jgi:HD-like signal output (HDOD) protein